MSLEISTSFRADILTNANVTELRESLIGVGTESELRTEYVLEKLNCIESGQLVSMDETFPDGDLRQVARAAASAVIWLQGAIKFHEAGVRGGRDIALAGAFAHAPKFPKLMADLSTRLSGSPRTQAMLEHLSNAANDIDNCLTKVSGREKDFAVAKLHLADAIGNIGLAFKCDS